MEILYQLGLNNTFWSQLAFFLISSIFLWKFMFTPYVRIIEYRRKNTVGATDQAAHLIAAADQLAVDYEGRVKSQTERVNTIFSEIKKQSAAEEEKIIAEARAR